MKKLNKNGDTIVEVLIALAILGLVIGSAYSIASRSLKSAQQAQERTQATKLAEGQIDSIKYLSESANVADDVLFASATAATEGSKKCIVKPDGQTVIQVLNDDGENCKYGTFFKRLLWYDDVRRLFTIRVEWDSVVSGVSQDVTMQYRVVQ
jgi:type II secretory pathway pseudopilin PulG